MPILFTSRKIMLASSYNFDILASVEPGTPMLRTIALAVLCGVFQVARTNAQDADEYRPLFNGENLDGWVNVNCGLETWTVREGLLHCTGVPTGALRTERHYENFVLELEWRHLKPGGNAGVFIWAGPLAAPGVPFLRSIEVQVLDHAYGKADWFTTHGDVFPIHGSTMKPFEPSRGSRSFPKEEHSRGSPEWNHYRITGNDGVLQLAVNGVEVSGGSECNYRKGYIALESEGGEVDWRNIRIRELPSTEPAVEEVAPLAEGFASLYTGVDLSGWDARGVDAWQASDWHLVADARDIEQAAQLLTETSFGDFELIFDWRFSGEEGKQADDDARFSLIVRGRELTSVQPATWPRGEWRRWRVKADGESLTLQRGEVTVDFAAQQPHLVAQEPGPIGFEVQGAAVELANIYVKQFADE